MAWRESRRRVGALGKISWRAERVGSAGLAGVELLKPVLHGGDPGGAFAGWLPRGLKLE